MSGATARAAAAVRRGGALPWLPYGMPYALRCSVARSLSLTRPRPSASSVHVPVAVLMSSPYTVYVLKFEQNDLRPGASPSSSELRRAGSSMIYLPPPVRFRATARPAGRDPGPRPRTTPGNLTTGAPHRSHKRPRTPLCGQSWTWCHGVCSVSVSPKAMLPGTVRAGTNEYSAESFQSARLGLRRRAVA